MAGASKTYFYAHIMRISHSERYIRTISSKNINSNMTSAVVLISYKCVFSHVPVFTLEGRQDIMKMLLKESIYTV